MIRMDYHKLSLVIPCYNEEDNAENTVRDCLQWFDQAGIQGELIAVDDGSKDKTYAVLERLAKADPRLKVVRHEKNQGYGLALRTGLDAAQNEILAYMDSDGQFKAKDLALLLPHLATFDFVTGRRRKRADSFVRNTFGKVLGLMNWITLGLWVRDTNCGMKTFRKSLWPRIRPTHGVEKLFNTEMFLRMKEQGIPWATINVPHYPRLLGNPTGAKLYVIVRMFKELMDLRKAKKVRMEGYKKFNEATA